MKKLVIFDLDGTLIDTIADLGTAVNHALSRQSLPTHPIEAFRAMVGHGVSVLVRNAMPEELKTDDKLHSELLADFLEYYSSHIHEYSRPYEGIPELLTELQDAGIKLAVASNKFQSGTEAVVGHFFPDIKFCAVLGVVPERPLKPDPEVIEEILRLASSEEHPMDKKDAVMVGDSGTDMKTARNAGVENIAVTWGFKPEAAAENADSVVNSAGELTELLFARRG